MRALLKRVIRSSLYRLGYMVVPVAGSTAAASSEHERVVAELAFCRAMRDIHRHDAVEVEELYRRFVFPGLPRDERRAGLLHELIGTTIGEAIYIIQNLHEGLRVPGDVCEFGVAQGATSRLLASEIMSTDRKLWLFDSFEGLPAPGPQDKLINDIFSLGSMDKYKGTMASPEVEVRSKLDSISFPRARTKVKKGWVSDSIKSGELPAQVAFAYVDFDFYEPIKDALEFLDGRMPPGGRIVVDDYGFFSEGAQLAVDQFVARVGSRFKFELPLRFAGHFCVLNKLA
jgi:O-methyltransferase